MFVRPRKYGVHAEPSRSASSTNVPSCAPSWPRAGGSPLSSASGQVQKCQKLKILFLLGVQAVPCILLNKLKTAIAVSFKPFVDTSAFHFYAAVSTHIGKGIT